ncbi:mucin-2 [Streptomyces sp. NPDC016640]|uniref:mucin-2 n=1 Tax=Streptomyces sp. NPDC016640 TaxID=3364969 RepID=UPI0037017AD0
MRTYATAQLIGDRTHQCDVTAVATAPSGARAYVLLDGIGSSDTVRDWTCNAARRLARTAARRGHAEAGLRAVYNRLTSDHNLRRIYPPRDGSPGGNRNIITSCLGATETDEENRNQYGHPAIETAVCHADTFRLLLASDGAYEPHEDAGHHLADQLIGTPGEAARHFVDTAVATARAAINPHADNATVLIADIRR